ncbi:MAG TPA: sulfotransferase domain-containing protein, partial [Gammaproteobacteria bacterium]|nr:sulfotransferase domain-containing protein [Gammaproteobacteria bacterium]
MNTTSAMQTCSHTTGLTFLGIGAQKAGTTWLAKWLSMHPEVHMPVKEIHFWDHPPFSPARLIRYKNRFESSTKKAHGEITPKYAILPLDTIKLIHDNFPKLRIIYILRNPIERAWSQVRMEYARRMYKDNASPSDMSTDWFIEHMLSEESISRGSYTNCIRNWLTYFSRDQLRIFIYEKDLAMPRKMLAECCQHLEINDSFYNSV